MGKCYTVQEMEAGIPKVTLRGKWLKEIGLDVGTKLKYVPGKNMIILMKVPEKEAKKQEQDKTLQQLEKQITILKRKDGIIRVVG